MDEQQITNDRLAGLEATSVMLRHCLVELSNNTNRLVSLYETLASKVSVLEDMIHVKNIPYNYPSDKSPFEK